MGSHVAIARGPTAYHARAPFSPAAAYPEYPFEHCGVAAQADCVYDTVRNSLRLFGTDEARFGTPKWNPLRGIVVPGDTVVIKPNFVRHFRDNQDGDGDCLITHGSVIRAVLDYAYIAMAGQGRLIVADAPHNDADFDAICGITGLREIQSFYRINAKCDLEVHDLRPEMTHKIDGVIVGHETLAGDPAGYVKVNLGAHSAFTEINDLCHLLYGSEYDTAELRRHQNHDVHEYLISKTVLDANVVISLPKLKTHKKVGLTVNLKNIVGINGNKNWLPHHREGTPAQGGDQFAEDALINHIERTSLTQFKRLFPYFGPLRSRLAKPLKKVGSYVFGDTNKSRIRSGNWHGNDTTWRMVLDLNRILLYADHTGRLHDRPVRRFLSVVDGIVGGEGNGPLDPLARPCGYIVAGSNAVATDMACARLMDFDHRKLPLLSQALARHPLPLASFTYDDIQVHSDARQLNLRLCDIEGHCLRFKPHFGWRGHVERCAVRTAESD